MRVYHGTTADNLESIKTHGLLCSEKKLWSCSQDAVYLWSERYLEREGLDTDDTDALFRQAYESAMCGLSCATDCRMVVVVADIDDELEEDDSCENMEHASCIRRNILPSEIVEIYVSNDLTIIKGHFIALMMRMDLFAHYFSVFERKIGELFKEFYPEDIDELLEWNLTRSEAMIE